MATKRILRLTNQEATVKVNGAVGTVTVDLQTDLKLASENLVGTQVVNIVGYMVTGDPNCTVKIIRGGETLYSSLTDNSPTFDFLEFGGTADTSNNTADITITTAGTGEAQLLLKLRKQSGYETRFRPEQTGRDELV